MAFDKQIDHQTLSPPLGSQPGEAATTAFHNELTQQISEQSLGGMLIGDVRGLIGGDPKTSADKASRAQSDDQIAQIAADTISAIPGVKTWAGGLIRATMLIDPTKGFSGNISSFGVNFLEGMALNKVSKMAMPGSALSRLTAARLGSGLAAESLTNLTVGFGFGALRQGFNRDSWIDKNGDTSVTKGIESMLEGGAIGGLINLPAGFIGMRVARASSLMLGNNLLPVRLATTVAGIGSGYAAGGVFGGVDAVTAHKSFADVLKSVNEGGIIGAISGGVMGGIPSDRISAPVQAEGAGVPSDRISAPVQAEGVYVPSDRINAPVQAEGVYVPSDRSSAPVQAAGATVPVERFITAGSAAKEELAPASGNVDKARVEPPAKAGLIRFDMTGEVSPSSWRESDVAQEWLDQISFKSESARLTDVIGRLSAPVQGRQEFATVPEGVTGPFKDINDFFAHVNWQDRPVRIYSVEGQTAKIVVPEDYAKTLDQVRDLRLRAERPNAVLDSSKITARKLQSAVANNDAETFQSLVKGLPVNEISDAIPILQARVALNDHQHGMAALPEDFIGLMDELPNRSNIKQLTLLNEPSYLDPWHQQTYDPTFKAAANAAQETGEVSFFKAMRDDPASPQRSGALRQILFHEDTHLEADKNGLFAAAAKLEKDGYYVSDYAERDEFENNAEHRSNGFLNPDTDYFLTAANYTPIRTAVIARQLADSMASTPKSMESPFAAQYQSRIDFVNTVVLPDVQQQLVDGLSAPDAVTREASAKLLGYLGDQSHQSNLAEIAANDSDSNVAKTALDSILHLHNEDPKLQIAKLWELGSPKSDVRELAIEKMRSMTTTDRAAGNYANILALMTTADNLPRVADQIAQIHSYTGKDLAFQNAISLGREYPNFQKNLALIVMRENPSLRVPALKSLVGTGTEGLRSIAQEYASDPVREVRNAAQQLIRNVDAQTLVQRSVQELNNGRTLSIETINALGRSRSRDAIEPLIRATLNGPESTRQAATNNLGWFSPNIVKFYARMVRAQLPLNQLDNLRPIMDGRFPSGQGYAG